MTLQGQVRGGIIIFDPPVSLPEGAEVQVQVIQLPTPESANQPPSLYERLKPFIGAAKGLPTDFAAQHDHYLYRTPKPISAG